jgi:hypothetical protein
MIDDIMWRVALSVGHLQCQQFGIFNLTMIDTSYTKYRVSRNRGKISVANALDIQGETSLASKVRNFTRDLPRVLTDRERVAVAFTQHMEQDPSQMTSQPTITKTPEFTR